MMAASYPHMNPVVSVDFFIFVFFDVEDYDRNFYQYNCFPINIIRGVCAAVRSHDPERKSKKRRINMTLSYDSKNSSTATKTGIIVWMTIFYGGVEETTCFCFVSELGA
ncbi:MAG: hypothetical protein NZL83_00385 [Candidatus Absconditabacterales bacterium]|nr:hypothetical protein [Candidatus Absconditabacterales bacterium]